MATATAHHHHHHVDASAAAADDFDDRRVVAAIDNLLDDTDDEEDVQPPPPPFSDDDDDDTTARDNRLGGLSTSDEGPSARSSPDDSYSSSTDAAPGVGATEKSSNDDPASTDAAKFLVPFAIHHADGDDVAALEELEALSARNDDDDASYHGGATTDGDTDDDAMSDCASPAGGQGSRHRNLHDDDFSLDVEDDDDAEHAAQPHEPFFCEEGDGHEEFEEADEDAGFEHPFLDLEAQRRQVDWDKSQLRAAYHGEMQRTVTLGYEDRVVALRALMNEADRYHRRFGGAVKRDACASTVCVPPAPESLSALSDEDWENLRAEFEEDLVMNGPQALQRNLSCMCIFSMHSAAREYGEHEEERARRQAGQHRTLQALRLQAMRGGSPYFLRPESTSGRGTPMPHHHHEL